MYPNNSIIYYNIKIIIPCRARAEIHGFFFIAPAAAYPLRTSSTDTSTDNDRDSRLALPALEPPNRGHLNGPIAGRDFYIRKRLRG